ncbi:hypothetical protein Nmel_008351 [Mimus melanotis]
MERTDQYLAESMCKGTPGLVWFLSDTAARQILQYSFLSLLQPSAGLRPPARRTPTSRPYDHDCSRLHTIPGKLWVTLLCFPGTNCIPALADGRAAAGSLHPNPLAPPGPRRGCPRSLPRTGTSRSPPCQRRRFLAVAQPAPFRCSSAFPFRAPMARPPGPPVTQQVGRARGCGRRPEQEQLREAARCLVLDSDGRSVPFQALYAEQKAIVLFVRVRRGRRGAQPGSRRGLGEGGGADGGEESTEKSSTAPETPALW